VSNIFKDLQETASEKNIKLHNKIKRDFSVSVDKKKFNILLKNLIENAIK